MKSPISSSPPAPDSLSRPRLLWEDCKSNLAYTFRVWRNTTLILTSAMLLFCAYAFFLSNTHPELGAGQRLLLFVLAIFYYLFFCALVAVPAAGCLLVYRLIGMAIVLPFVLIPLLTYFWFWLGSGFLSSAFGQMLAAMADAQKESPYLSQFKDMGGGGGHGAGSLMFLVLAAYLLLHIYVFLTTWAVLSKILLFLFLVVLLLLLGLLSGFFASLPFLIKSIVKRYRKRVTCISATVSTPEATPPESTDTSDGK